MILTLQIENSNMQLKESAANIAEQQQTLKELEEAVIAIAEK